jgi:Protein of unknown function (DUF2867)
VTMRTKGAMTMPFTEGPFPRESSLNRDIVESAWFADSYRTQLTRPTMSVVDLFEAVLGHHPQWAKSLLILRNRLAGLAGLAVAPDAAIRSFARKSHYAVGDTIGPRPIFHLSETELIAGRDNHHLDFRVSILKLAMPAPAVAISTICNVHNRAGKLYLFFIVPFHRWGMRYLMRQAVAAGRL